MRTTLHYWFCGSCKEKNGPEHLMCTKCGDRRITRNAQVHVSERAVVYYNPATGEHRTPPRNDMPMPEIYAKQGYERMEIMNMSAWEKQAGVIHEASHFNPGNEPIPGPPEPKGMSPEVKQELIDDMRAAIASGPFTGLEKLADLPSAPGEV